MAAVSDLLLVHFFQSLEIFASIVDVFTSSLIYLDNINDCFSDLANNLTVFRQNFVI